jgi:hypothetical protein
VQNTQFFALILDQSRVAQVVHKNFSGSRLVSLQKFLQTTCATRALNCVKQTKIQFSGKGLSTSRDKNTNMSENVVTEKT